MSLALAAAVVGSLVPVVAAVLTQAHFTRAANTVIAAAVSVAAGAATAYTTGQLDGADIVTAVGAVFVAAQATYRGVYEPLGLTPRLRELTTFRLPATGGRHREVAVLAAQVEALSKVMAESGAPGTVAEEVGTPTRA